MLRAADEILELKRRVSVLEIENGWNAEEIATLSRQVNQIGAYLGMNKPVAVPDADIRGGKEGDGLDAD